MLGYQVKGLKRLSADRKGVVSFEYVVVAACVVGGAAVVFGADTAGGVTAALTNALSAIEAAIATAIGV
ncbi:hypothetical protein ACFQZO_31045 [Bradyrhizobium sp. GCM10027634]|uniref:hypothetical protein n=1 Tax=unclassified Bradyrhizobium TaxID=2631580 RepID=UPI00263AB1EA|nr:hypothetical protein [Bradyrhizobium sp. WYCCWR 12677]MDN5005299.1 hypothetical protein [Bradyrhizobium sp. WYCCWR 12677]